MEAQELRIGNYVHVKYSRSGLKDSDVELTYESFLRFLHLDISEIAHPIPLTEEWLIKFGFEFWCDELGIKAYYKVYGVEYFCVATNGFWQLRGGLKDKDGAWRMGNNYPFIKSVHQLQNLYFALTNTELTIK